MGKAQNTSGPVFDMRRAEMARVQYINAFCQDIPLPYQMLIPPSCDAAELLEAENMVRRMIERDFKAYQEEPFMQTAQKLDLLDFSNVDSSAGLMFRCRPMLGMTQVIRRGFENHPDVLAAIEKAQQGPEYAKAAKRRELVDAKKAAEKALNAADPAEVATVDNLRAVYTKAKRELLIFDGIDPAELDAMEATQAAYRALDRARAAGADADTIAKLQADVKAAEAVSEKYCG